MKLDIRTKLLGGFGLVIVLLIAVFVAGFVGLNSVASATDRIVHEELPEDIGVRELEVLVLEQTATYLDFAITKDQEDLTIIEHESEAVLEHILELKAEFEGDAHLTELLLVFAEEYDSFLAEGKVFTDEVQDGVTGAVLINELHTLEAKEVLLEEELQELATVIEEQIEEAFQGAESAHSTATTISIILMVIATAIALAVGYLLSRSISNGVNKVRGVLDTLSTVTLPRLQTVTAAVANGDLTIKSEISVPRADVKSSDEIGEMAKILNVVGDSLEMVGQSVDDMVDGLSEVITGVRDAAVGVANSSGELAAAAEQAGEGTTGIATAAQQIASGAVDQSSGIEKTTSEITQLATAITSISEGSQKQTESISQAAEIVSQVSRASGEVASNAQEATDGARVASEAADGGLETVRQTVDGMAKITGAVELAAKQIASLGEQSAEIGKIIGVIDDIAAQTNLLALNAALEAARAGEQGRGFAVVADEVRTLAERVTDATKEISELIQGVQSGVEESVRATEQAGAEVQAGSELATKSGEALDEIQKAVSGVSNQIEQISAAAEQVSASADEMVKTIESVSEVTEQNTAATEQMTASSDGVKQSINSIASVTEESASAAQEMSASTEQVGAQVQQVVASSQGLAEMATSLRNTVARFRLEAGEGDKEIRQDSIEGDGVPVPAT